MNETEVQSAAVDRALTAGDPAVAREHLRLVAALETTAGAGPFATATAVTLVLGAMARSDVSTPSTPGRDRDPAAVRGGALAIARFGRSLDGVAAATNLPPGALRSALTSV